MTLLRHGCWPLLAMLALVFPAATAHSENLDEAWSIALAVNHRLRAAQDNTSAAEETAASARAARLPSMSNTAGAYALSSKPSYQAQLGPPFGSFGVPFLQQSFFTSLNLVNQPLYTGGRITSGIAAAESGVHAAQSDEGRVALDLKLNVAEAYVNVLYSQRLLTVAQSNVTGLENHVRVVAELVKEKQRVNSDQLAAEVQLGNARQQFLQAQNQSNIALASYNRYLGRPLGAPVSLEELLPLPIEADLDCLTAQALAQRPELAGLHFQREGLQHQAKAVRAEAKPQIAALGGLVYLEDRYLVKDAFGVAGVAVRWDLDAGVTRHRAKALDFRAQAVGAERVELESVIALQVRQAFLDAQTANEALPTARRAVEQAEENVKAATNRYRNGTGTNTEVLDAHTLHLRSAANHYNAQYNEVLAVLRLRRAIGSL